MMSEILTQNGLTSQGIGKRIFIKREPPDSYFLMICSALSNDGKTIFALIAQQKLSRCCKNEIVKNARLYLKHSNSRRAMDVGDSSLD